MQATVVALSNMRSLVPTPPVYDKVGNGKNDAHTRPLNHIVNCWQHDAVGLFAD